MSTSAIGYGPFTPRLKELDVAALSLSRSLSAGRPEVSDLARFSSQRILQESTPADGVDGLAFAMFVRASTAQLDCSESKPKSDWNEGCTCQETS